MKYRIDNHKNKPAYLQIYMQIRDDIVNGVYRHSDKLPSKRILSADLGVSTVTIEHAYGLLCDEGYIEARQRSGYYVIFRKDEGFVSTTEVQIDWQKGASAHNQSTNNYSVNNLGVNAHRANNPSANISNSNSHSAYEFPFSVLAKTMRSVISELEEGILERSHNLGVVELREAIGMYLMRSRGIEANVNQIVIGSGSEYLYTLLVEYFGRECVYAIENPSYKKIEQVYTAADVRLEKLPLGKDGIDSRSLKMCKADVLHISPYRSYPSGVTATASKRHEYLQWAKCEGRYIIEDDFESEFSISKKTEETLFSHSKQENVIYMNTFSKTISPSLRVGYMVLPKQMAQTYEERLGFYSCTVPTYIQYVLARLINNGDFERHINRVRRMKRKELTNKKNEMQ